MAKYKVVVEVEPYKPGIENGIECGLWDLKHRECSKEVCLIKKSWEDIKKKCVMKRPYINTAEGKYYINVGDWIVTGIKGEKYIIKKDVFRQIYKK
jgi:hypothetical protein